MSFKDISALCRVLQKRRRNAKEKKLYSFSLLRFFCCFLLPLSLVGEVTVD